MLIAMQKVKLCAHCYTWSEYLCSLLYLVGSVMLGVKLYAHCYTWSKAL